MVISKVLRSPAENFSKQEDKIKIRTHRQKPKGSDYFKVVEIVGLEPMTFCMSSKRSNQLSYTSAVQLT